MYQAVEKREEEQGGAVRSREEQGGVAGRSREEAQGRLSLEIPTRLVHYLVFVIVSLSVIKLVSILHLNAFVSGPHQ